MKPNVRANFIPAAPTDYSVCYMSYNHARFNITFHDAATETGVPETGSTLGLLFLALMGLLAATQFQSSSSGRVGTLERLKRDKLAAKLNPYGVGKGLGQAAGSRVRDWTNETGGSAQVACCMDNDLRPEIRCGPKRVISHLDSRNPAYLWGVIM